VMDGGRPARHEASPLDASGTNRSATIASRCRSPNMITGRHTRHGRSISAGLSPKSRLRVTSHFHDDQVHEHARVPGLRRCTRADLRRHHARGVTDEGQVLANSPAWEPCADSIAEPSSRGSRATAAASSVLCTRRLIVVTTKNRYPRSFAETGRLHRPGLPLEASGDERKPVVEFRTPVAVEEHWHRPRVCRASQLMSTSGSSERPAMKNRSTRPRDAALAREGASEKHRFRFQRAGRFRLASIKEGRLTVYGRR